MNPRARIEVTVLLRPRDDHPQSATALTLMERGAALPSAGRHLTRELFEVERGALPADVAKVETFAHQRNLTVSAVNIARRTVRLSGTIAALSAAFHAKLSLRRIGRRVHRVLTDEIAVPRELRGAIVTVLGFDDRPVVEPRCRSLSDLDAPRGGRKGAASRPRAKGATGASAPPGPALATTYNPPDVARLYNKPPGLDGSGQCIAIIEINTCDINGSPVSTGYDPNDLNAYFASLGIPSPVITAVGVDGGANVPGVDERNDNEVMLDIEIAGSIAPGAQIAVYFAPNTDAGFYDALSSAVHDVTRKPSVISISWGGREELWSKRNRHDIDLLLQDAAALGITVCCASGDDGSSDIHHPGSKGDGKPHVDFPASSSFVLACGGTKLTSTGAGIASEVVWNSNGYASGGGVSMKFDIPTYQVGVGVPKRPNGKVGRGVPDVAGNADIDSGYRIIKVGGQADVAGGTSCVAPLWSALIALFNQSLAQQNKPTAGFINPVLYDPQTSASVFHDIVSGDNDLEQLGKYSAAVGWDACTGLGTPDATLLLHALGA